MSSKKSSIDLMLEDLATRVRQAEVAGEVEANRGNRIRAFQEHLYRGTESEMTGEFEDNLAQWIIDNDPDHDQLSDHLETFKGQPVYKEAWSEYVNYTDYQPLEKQWETWEHSDGYAVLQFSGGGPSSELRMHRHPNGTRSYQFVWKDWGKFEQKTLPHDHILAFHLFTRVRD